MRVSSLTVHMTPTTCSSTAASVRRTCKNIISKNQLLDLFGEKGIKDGIARDLEKLPDIKIS